MQTMRVDAFRIGVLILGGFICLQLVELYFQVKQAQAWGIGHQPSISKPAGEYNEPPPPPGFDDAARRELIPQRPAPTPANPTNDDDEKRRNTLPAIPAEPPAPPPVDDARQRTTFNPQQPETMPATTILRAVYRMEEDKKLALTAEQAQKLLELMDRAYQPTRQDYAGRLIPLLTTDQIRYIIDHRHDEWAGQGGRTEATIAMLERISMVKFADAPAPSLNPPNVFPDRLALEITPEDAMGTLVQLDRDPKVSLTRDQALAMLSTIKAAQDQRKEEESINERILELLTADQRKAVDGIRANIANLPGNQEQELTDLLKRLRARTSG